MAVDLIICGAFGRMGRAIQEMARDDADVRVVGLVEAAHHPRLREPVPTAGGSVSVSTAFPRAPGAVAIDFSSPEGAVAAAREAVVNGNPLVVGTTGLSEMQVHELEHAARKIAVVYSANMSIGVNILWRLAREAARLLGRYADVEIIEAHHGSKKDAPSGTALAAARAVAEGMGTDPQAGMVFGRHGMVGERRREEIGIHAVRAGDIAGDHTVLFGMEGERLELVHRAHSQMAFARGAIMAAKFAVKAKPGMYSMAHVLELDSAK